MNGWCMPAPAPWATTRAAGAFLPPSCHAALTPPRGVSTSNSVSDIRPSCTRASGCVLHESDQTREPPAPRGPVETLNTVPVDPPAELCGDDDRRRPTEVGRRVPDVRVAGDQVVQHL